MKYEENKKKLDDSEKRICVSDQEHKLLIDYRALSDENKLTMDILCKRLLEHEKGRKKID